jgi:hypothetical protein
MALNRAQHRKQLTEGLNTVFGMEYKRHPEQWKGIFDIERSEKAYEEDVLNVGLGAAQVKPEGGAFAYDEGAEAWVARYNHITVALGFAITEEAEEDNLTGSLGARYAKSLARSLQHTKEVTGANILNNGFSASFTGGDNKALFATDHPIWAGGSASNTFSTPADFSETSLEEALIAIANFKDDRNIPIVTRALKVIGAPDLTFVAERVLKSNLRPGTGDNDINAVRSLGRIPQGFVENHRLTDTDAWFIKTDCPDGLKHFIRKNVQRGMEGDFDTGNMRYKARERYSFGWTDWRGAFGSPGV